MNRDYSKITDEQFDAILHKLVGNMSTAEILAHGDVYSFFREELNNEVLKVWEEDNPPTLKEKQERLMQEILCTAYEGGSAYWAEARNVKREGPDLDYVSYELKDQEDPDDEWRVVDVNKLFGVFDNLRFHPKLYDIAEKRKETYLAAFLDPDNADLDAEDADILVQLALYSEVIFG